LNQDLRFAMRHLMRSPGFALSAILTLALGIGANLTVFLILYGVILRPLPFPHPEQLMRVARLYPGSGDSPAYAGTKYLVMARTNRSFESMTAYDFFPHGVNLMEENAAVPLQALAVSSNFFHTFEMEPVLGHGFAPEDMQKNAPGVVVLSDATWRHQFNADPNIVGRAITLGNRSYTVVGVANPKFHLDAKADLWVPLQIAESPLDTSNLYNVVGRLKSSVTPAMATEDLKRTLLLRKEAYPNLWQQEESVHVWDFHDSLVGQIKPALNILMGAVGLLLVMVSANILSLLLTRAIARRREMSVRVALGASTWRLLQQTLVENLLLCALGALAGSLLAQLASPALLRLSPIQLPDFVELRLGGIGTSFAAFLAFVCAVLFSVVPVIEAQRGQLNESLRLNPTQVAAGKNRAQRVLVVGEVALSLVLLVGAALLLTSFWKLVHTSAGFEARNVVTFKTSFSEAQTSSTATFGQLLDQLSDRTEALPGVESAAAAINLPTQIVPDFPFDVVGRAANRLDATGDERFIPITSDYFAVMKIPVPSGRGFTKGDNSTSEQVMVVNQAFVKAFFSNENPIGQHLNIAGSMGEDFQEKVRVIVGVVGDTKQQGLDQASPPIMYVPAAQLPDKITRLDNKLLGMSWVVRTKSAQVELANPIRQVFMDTAHVPISGMATLEKVMSDAIAQQRFNMLLLSGFGVIALLLGAAGLYGVMSYTVARQTKEIGVRMALGAKREDILRMVLREAGLLVGVGMIVGLVAALAGGKLLSSILFGVAARDPLTLLVVCGLLLLTGMFSAWWPARRAASVEPMRALRIE
jgi:predicted permease